MVSLIEHFNTVTGVSLNLVLLYAIRRFTRKSIGSYKYLLAIFAAFDVFLCIVHAVVQPIVLIVGSTFGVGCALEDKRSISIFCACFTVPFALMIIHFLYRFWSIRYPHLIALFSSKTFISLLTIYPITAFIVWYLLSYYGTHGERGEPGAILLIEESRRRFGKAVEDGWMVMDYWEGNVFHLDLFLCMLSLDAIMVGSFSVAATLGGYTLYFIIREKQKISMHARSMQLKLFLIVCTQTFVPFVFVYIPYFCVINLAFFRLPVFMDNMSVIMATCFPSWDALIMILLMKDYRHGLMSMVRRKKVQPAETKWKSTTVSYSVTMHIDKHNPYKIQK